MKVLAEFLAIPIHSLFKCVYNGVRHHRHLWLI